LRERGKMDGKEGRAERTFVGHAVERLLLAHEMPLSEISARK